MKSTQKNLDWKSQPWRKVNGQSQRLSQSQRSNPQSQKMTLADDASKWRQQRRKLGLMWITSAMTSVRGLRHVRARDGTWEARDLMQWRVRENPDVQRHVEGACGVWSTKQSLWVVRGGACSLQRCRGFHDCVDWHKMISVVPSKPWLEQYLQQWCKGQWSVQCEIP